MVRFFNAFARALNGQIASYAPAQLPADALSAVKIQDNREKDMLMRQLHVSDIRSGSSLFRMVNLWISIREVHHVIAFLGFDQQAVDSYSQFESERFSGVMA